MYGAQKDGRQATANSREHYLGDGEINKQVAWAMVNIDNTQYMSKNDYSFEKFSNVVKYVFTILNNNGNNNPENQMVRNMIKKMKVPKNLEMDACKKFFSNTHKQIFFNAVAYLSGQVTEIFTNTQLENKKKRRLSEVRTKQRRGTGHGCGNCQSNRRNGGSGRGSGGRGGDTNFPYNTWNYAGIQGIYRDFSSANWDAFKGYGQAYTNRQRRCGRAGVACGNDGTRGGRGSGGGCQVSEADTDWYKPSHGGGDHGGRGTQWRLLWRRSVFTTMLSCIGHMLVI